MSGYTRKDPVYRAAKREGFRSRAAIKLEELDERYRLLRPDARVVDLGCWPGGWLQVAVARVGKGGRVVGVDLEPVEDLGRENVVTLVADVGDPGLRDRVRTELGGPADLVLCDAAPKLTGVKVADRERHLVLTEQAAALAAELMAPRGRAVFKIFGAAEEELTSMLRRCFGSVTKFRPPASRKGSSELYAVVGQRGRGQR